MLRRRQPARAPRLSRILAALVVLVATGLVVLLAIKPAIQLLRQTGCSAGTPGQPVALSPGQAAIAATIAGVASRMHMPDRAVAIAYATAWQESKLSNLDYGTLDSVGVFQQRPSEGWGTAREIENPVYATTRFLAALARVPHYRRLPIDQAAQDVQRSADGAAYGQYALTGTDMAAAFTGTVPHGVWCSYGSGVGRPRLAAARRALDEAFGRLPVRLSADPAGRVAVSNIQQGWAIASWLVANASGYGITSVRYDGYQWRSGGQGPWVRLKPGAGTRAATTAVAFG